jgi:hypothetical protein
VTDIFVRNCTVRVVRRGGWSWGTDPRGLLDDVLAAVPALIAEALAAGVADGADAVIREPVRVSVPLRRTDLALAFQGALHDRAVTGQAPAAIHQRPRATGPAVQARPPGPAALRLLLSWERNGLLSELLDRLPEPVLAVWHHALVEGWRAPPVAAPDGAELAEALAEAAADAVAGPAHDRAAWLRRHLAALTVIAARTGLVPCQPEVQAAVEARLGPPPASKPRASATEELPPSPADSASPPGHATVRPGGPAVLAGAAPGLIGRPARESRISPVLPFLALVPLARTGWLDTLAVAVEAAKLTDHWPTLAAAIAFKVLSPPEHGWRRSPEDLAAAAAFAGVGEPLAEGALPADARLLAPPLDAVLGRSLADGHRPGAPLVLTVAYQGDGLVLLDGEGLFPMAWADDAAGLASWLHACADARIVLGPGAGPWPAAQREPGDQDLLRRADLVLAELGRRPALPVAAGPDLERSLTLGAGAGLAAIAWTLWGEHEPTDPVLAIDRLASLGATVRHGGERMSVVIPLGARYFDLQRHGLLGEVREVPWLDGRTIEIVGG